MKYRLVLEFETLEDLQGWIDRQDGPVDRAAIWMPAPYAGETICRPDADPATLARWSNAFVARVYALNLPPRIYNRIARAAGLSDVVYQWNQENSDTEKVTVKPFIQDAEVFTDVETGRLMTFSEWRHRLPDEPELRERLLAIPNFGPKLLATLLEALQKNAEVDPLNAPRAQ